MFRHFLSIIIPCKKTPILVYHKVDNIPQKKDKFRLAISTKSFEKQMQYISKNRKCLKLEDYVTSLRKGKKIPANSVVITFDDGYSDNYTNAFPILMKYNLAATFFIVTSFVGLTNKWDELRGEIISNLLSWDQVNMMSRAGMSFGSHSCTHPRFTTCADEQLEQELRKSKTTLEERLNKKIRLFSYPWGDSDLRTTQILKTAGYIAACSDCQADSEDFIIYNVNRIQIRPSDSLVLFKIKVSGWYNWILKFVRASRLQGAMRKIRVFSKQEYRLSAKHKL